MKVSELTGAKLDYWVAKAIKLDADLAATLLGLGCPDFLEKFKPSRSWAHGGPIIEREMIDVSAPDEFADNDRWFAGMYQGRSLRESRTCETRGETPLIAAMRSFVMSKFGDEVPDAEDPPPTRTEATDSSRSQVQDEAAYRAGLAAHRAGLAAYQKRVDRIARMSKAMNIPKTDKLPTGTDAIGSNEEQLRRKELAEAEIRASQDSAITDALIARMERRLELYDLERGKPKPDPQ